MLDADNSNANTFDVDATPRQRIPQRRSHQSLSSYAQPPYAAKNATGSNPVVQRSTPTTIVKFATDRHIPSKRVQEKGGCNCNSLLLSQNSPKSLVITPLWGFTPDWAPEWSGAEIEKEEARRLVWASLMLAAGHTSHAASHGIHRREALDFWLTRAENVSLSHYFRLLDSGANYQLHSMLSYILVRRFSLRWILDMTVRGHIAILYGRCTQGRSCCGIHVSGCGKQRPSATR